MKSSIIPLFFVLIVGTSAQQSSYRDLFGSFGTVIDSKNNFLKTAVSTITAPFRLPENQQSLKSGSTNYMESPAGFTQQAKPLNIPSSSGADILVLSQLLNNPQLLEYYNSQLLPAAVPPTSGQVTQFKSLIAAKDAPSIRAMYSNDPQGIKPGNVPQEVLSSPHQEDIPILIRILTVPQTAPMPNDQIAELRTLFLKLLTQQYVEMDSKAALEGQTTKADLSNLAGNVETSTSPLSPTPSTVLDGNMEQSTPSLSLTDPIDNEEHATP